MKPYGSRSSRQPYFSAAQIDGMCIDELCKQGLYPSSPQAIRIDRFVEKRFDVTPQYEQLPDGVLGFTRFSKDGVDGIVISAALDAEGGKVAERRIRTTLAHEAGHGFLHAQLFALGDVPAGLFDEDSRSDHQILCRDIQGCGEERKRSYDGRWWEFQANRAIGGLLCPRPLVQEALNSFLLPKGSLGALALQEDRRDDAARALSDIFDVNPVVARIRISELFPPETGQLLL
jgi:hypothetical protein